MRGRSSPCCLGARFWAESMLDPLPRRRKSNVWRSIGTPKCSSFRTDMDPTSVWFYPALFVTGLAAGFVDSIAGGGGLITLPVLLSAGLAPQDALGTNKLQ